MTTIRHPKSGKRSYTTIRGCLDVHPTRRERTVKIVEISDKTYDRLQALAEPFTDTPGSVIVRLLSFYEQYKENPSQYHPNLRQSRFLSLNLLRFRQRYSGICASTNLKF